MPALFPAVITEFRVMFLGRALSIILVYWLELQDGYSMINQFSAFEIKILG